MVLLLHFYYLLITLQYFTYNLGFLSLSCVLTRNHSLLAISYAVFFVICIFFTIYKRIGNFYKGFLV